MLVTAGTTARAALRLIRKPLKTQSLAMKLTGQRQAALVRQGVFAATRQAAPVLAILDQDWRSLSALRASARGGAACTETRM